VRRGRRGGRGIGRAKGRTAGRLRLVLHGASVSLRFGPGGGHVSLGPFLFRAARPPGSSRAGAGPAVCWRKTSAFVPPCQQRWRENFQSPAIRLDLPALIQDSPPCHPDRPVLSERSESKEAKRSGRIWAGANHGGSGYPPGEPARGAVRGPAPPPTGA
jgi:hypothetical protein